MALAYSILPSGCAHPPTLSRACSAETDVVSLAPDDRDAVNDGGAENVKRRQEITRAAMLAIEARREAEIEEMEAEAEDEQVMSSPLAAGKPGALEVNVNSMGGRVVSTTADRTWTVLAVKSKVAAASRIPLDQQRLFWDARELEDHKLLHDIVPPGTTNMEISLVRADPERMYWREALLTSGMQLGVAPAHICEDAELVELAVAQNGFALEHASKELRACTQIVQAAVDSKGMALKFASADLQSERRIVLTAVRENGMALRFADATLQAEPEVVFAAVANNSSALQYASAELRADPEFVCTLLEVAGLALKFVATSLQAERKLVLVAVRENGLALEYASEELRADREIVEEAVQVNGLALWDAADELRADPQIVALAKFAS